MAMPSLLVRTQTNLLINNDDFIILTFKNPPVIYFAGGFLMPKAKFASDEDRKKGAKYQR